MGFFKLNKEKIIFTIIGTILYFIAFISSTNTYIVCDIGTNCPSVNTFQNFLAKLTFPLFLSAEITGDVLGLSDFGIYVGAFLTSLIMWYFISCIFFYFYKKR